MKAEIASWMPDFNDLSLIDKLRLGFTTTFGHFVSVPSVVLLMFTLSITIGVFCSARNKMKRLISLFPLCTDVIVTVYFSFTYLRNNPPKVYYEPTIHFDTVTDQILQVVAICGMVVFCVASIISLFWIFKSAKEAVVCMLILGTGGM